MFGWLDSTGGNRISSVIVGVGSTVDVGTDVSVAMVVAIVSAELTIGVVAVIVVESLVGGVPQALSKNVTIRVLSKIGLNMIFNCIKWFFKTITFQDEYTRQNCCSPFQVSLFSGRRANIPGSF